MKLIHTCVIAAALAIAAPAFAQSAGRDTWLEPEIRAQLKQGMTRDQVVQLLGKPSRLRMNRSGAGLAQDYEYRSGDGHDWMIVTFMGDVFFNYSVARLANPESASLKHCQNLAKWAQVQPGMHLEAVEEILGQPSATSYAGGFTPDEALTAWLYDVTSYTDGATGMVAVGPAGHVVAITEPLCPPAD